MKVLVLTMCVCVRVCVCAFPRVRFRVCVRIVCDVGAWGGCSIHTPVKGVGEETKRAVCHRGIL